MTGLDFITAFGRLLREGPLRDAFAKNPDIAAGLVNLRREDYERWRQLPPADVEFQAAVLLRKRFEAVANFIPATVHCAGDRLWPMFQVYGRRSWPAGRMSGRGDAFEFCQHLNQNLPGTVMRGEWNRLAFLASSRRAACYWTDLPVADKCRHGLQVFVRGAKGRCHEFRLHFRL